VSSVTSRFILNVVCLTAVLTSNLSTSTSSM
jgi:hypothetical protein